MPSSIPARSMSRRAQLRELHSVPVYRQFSLRFSFDEYKAFPLDEHRGTSVLIDEI